MRSTLSSPGQALHPTPDGGDGRRPITHGDEIEIWCRSLGTWSHGFVAVDIDADGWRVLRRSDRYPLPVRFPDADLRLAPPSSQGPHAG